MIKYYRKRPVTIEAVEWTGENFEEIADFCKPRQAYMWTDGSKGEANGLFIQTLEGDHKADIGDMIIKGVKGECYPCKPDIFEATYINAPEPGVVPPPANCPFCGSRAKATPFICEIGDMPKPKKLFRNWSLINIDYREIPVSWVVDCTAYCEDFVNNESDIWVIGENKMEATLMWNDAVKEILEKK